MKPPVTAAAFLALVLLTGCVTQTRYVHLTGNIMVDGPMMITNGPPQDKVLWQCRTAVTTPAADIRAWSNLPRYLSFASLSLPPGPHTATIEFLNGSGLVLPELTKTLTFTVPPSGKDQVVFVSDKSTTLATL